MNNLPLVLADLVCNFAYGITAQELYEDLDFYCAWSEKVPPVFLNHFVVHRETSLPYANPMIKHHPYMPMRHFDFVPDSIWAITLVVFCSMIDKEVIRELKTYKGCVLRWVRMCMSGARPEYFERLLKVFTRLEPHHFYPARQAFVSECLRQIRAVSSE